MRVSVKDLAEFVHRRGDIRYHQQSATLAAEGIARQKSYQADRDESYLREHRVRASFGELAISGRIDATCRPGTSPLPHSCSCATMSFASTSCSFDSSATTTFRPDRVSIFSKRNCNPRR